MYDYQQVNPRLPASSWGLPHSRHAQTHYIAIRSLPPKNTHLFASGKPTTRGTAAESRGAIAEGCGNGNLTWHLVSRGRGPGKAWQVRGRGKWMQVKWRGHCTW